MDDDTDIIYAIALTCAVLKAKKRKKKKPKRFWINSFLLDRNSKGRFIKDLEDMKAVPSIFFENFHVSVTQFYKLLGLVEQKLQPIVNTRPVDGISPTEKLCITLEFLASGSLQRHVASIYRVSKQRIGPIIEETCKAIFEEVGKEFLGVPSKQGWNGIANDYQARWNFPNCLGSIDGKHIAIKCPNKGETCFYNYKGFHSIVLMAVAAADYRFAFIDVGAYGSEADGHVFRKSSLGIKLFNETLDIPEDRCVNGKKLPHYFVADDAFPLTKRIMKPYNPKRGKTLPPDERIFNYRLSRARRCIENAFEILCARWMCLSRTMFVNPDRARYIVAACCALHNFQISQDKETYCPPGFVDSWTEQGVMIEGAWRRNISEDSTNMNAIPMQARGRDPVQAKTIRDYLKRFVNSKTGALEWQNSSVFL